MKFLDQAHIFVKSGSGGSGCISFKRKKNLEFGGPNGGNGGHGGRIIIKCVNDLNTLIDYRFQKHFIAKSGCNGSSKNMNGKNGKDIILKVPIGTQILDNNKLLLVDIIKKGQEYILLNGGNGGFGNAYFKSSINQSPRKANTGIAAEEMWINLQLRLIADACLIGFPNTGKSTFLANISSAKPKISNYPFTTLYPHLGVVKKNNQEFTMADIPGIIKNAHKGVGLGYNFLSHIERCSILIHLLDITKNNFIENYLILRKELKKYKFNIIKKPEILVLNKIDVLNKKEITNKIIQLKKITNKKIYTISAIKGINISCVLYKILNIMHINKKSLNNKKNKPWSPI